MRRALPFAVAALVALVGVVALLLALDVRRAQHQLRVGDAAATQEVERHDVWSTTQVVPFHLGERLLGIRDDLAYRDAARLFVRGHPTTAELFPSSFVSVRRAEAEAALGRIARTDTDAPRRSLELNMLGILSAISIPPSEPAARGQALLRAALSFRNAIAADEANAAAKYNLELTLRQLKETDLAGGTIRGLGGAATQSKKFGVGY